MQRRARIGRAEHQIPPRTHVWVGRLLPPSDRANLDGPFYLNQWEFPFVQAYPNIFAGRDDGAAVWGQVGGGRFKYQVGVFQGVEGPANGSDHLLYAGRLTLNLLDPEPGYYNASTYYGEKDILAIAAVLMHQQDAAGTAGSGGDFLGWNVDVLFEKNLEDFGVFSLEGAYYEYDLDGEGCFTNACPSGTSVEGESWFVLVSHLLPWEVGVGPISGKLKPLFWYQEYDHKFGGVQHQWELGLQYVIAGHNARVSLVYGRQDPGSGFSTVNIVRFGIQLQI